MARRPIAPQPQPAQLGIDQIRLGIKLLSKRLDQLRAFDPTEVSRQINDPALERIRASIIDGLARTFGEGTQEFERYSRAARFSAGPMNYLHQTPMDEVHKAVNESKERAIALLEQAVESLTEQLEDVEPEASVVGASYAAEDDKTAVALSRRVFVVHGHDGETREAVARFLAQIGFDPVILHEQASRGRTVIEKVEIHGDVGFAVILLTPDDIGALATRPQELKPRARQNVLLELGYFVGRLGRDNVCALKRGDLDLPSDFGGVVYEVFDDAGAWKTAVARELQAAGHSIDWNRVMR